MQVPTRGHYLRIHSFDNDGRTRIVIGITGELGAPPGSVNIIREDCEPINITRQATHPAFRFAVDKIGFSRQEDGIWLPSPELPLENKFTFARFINEAIGHARYKQWLASQDK
jgi:hypothetical protein